MTQLYVLVAVLAAATAFGLWRRAVDGRMRDVTPEPAGVRDSPYRGMAALPDGPPAADSGDVAGSADPTRGARDDAGEPARAKDTRAEAEALSSGDVGQALGERATLLQFSSAFCSPCRTARVVLGDVAGMVEGVKHVEIDAEDHLGLVRRLAVTRTPTVFVLDASGHIRTRATGAPRRADVIAALGKVV